VCNRPLFRAYAGIGGGSTGVRKLSIYAVSPGHLPISGRNAFVRLETTPLRPAWIRAPGRLQNTFANECFLDEIAAAAGDDPLHLRVRYTDPGDKRGLEVLDRLAKLAKWDERALPQKSIAGIPCRPSSLTGGMVFRWASQSSR
jgi:hypothetical protein